MEVDAQAIDVHRAGQLAGREAESYQGVPPVKKAPWEWYYIPVYFWVGGIAGGSGLAAAAEALVGDNDRSVVRAGRYLALGSVLASTALLVADLGRPERFLHMLRVFRARSPMSLGSWVLTGYGALSGTSAVLQAAEDGLLGERPRLASISRGWPGRLLDAGIVPVALLVSSYTGVLLSATSTPTWARRTTVLAPLFVASATSTGLAAVAAAVEATTGAPPGTQRRLARAETLALIGELALMAADRALARALPSAREEPASAKAARWLTIAAGMVVPLGIHLASGRRGTALRPRRGLLAAGLTLAGGLALRLLVTREGARSADTPADTWAFARDER